MRLHPINSGEIQLKVMDPRPPRRGPAELPRTLLGSLFRAAHWYPVPVFLVEHPSAGPLMIDVVDQDGYVRSGEEAREFVRAHPDALAIPSHDRELWPRLEPTYD